MLVNTARSPLVHQRALIRALEEGWIRGAAVDVYDQEPLPVGHPVRAAPNTLLTPHLGYVTHESYTQFYGGALEDVQAWLAGVPVRQLTSQE
ncbi:phosphoglycerate dehydrogenase-like enzyme [Arthrobacter sp. UYCu723]